MIELNLLPHELKKKKKLKIELPEIPIVPIAAGLIGILLIIQFVLTGLIFLNKKKLSVLDKNWEDLLPKKKTLDELKKELSTTTAKIDAIEGLKREQLNWSRLLNELSDSLTPNIWLTALVYDEKVEIGTSPAAAPTPGIAAQKTKESIKVPKKEAKPKNYRMRTLSLSGSASGKGEETTAYVAHFITALKANKYFHEDFEDVELISIKKAAVAGQDIMGFTLVCRFKPEEMAE